MDRRLILFTLLYASEGAPIGFIWWALPTLLRSADVPIDRITALTAVLLVPWVFKFLWAPALDVLRGPRWGYRAWLVTMQVIMALTLLPLAWLDPVTHFDVWRLLLLVHGFAAATQDVAIDALAIGAVPPAERGRLNGAMQAGMLTGRSVFGGGALLVAAWAGRAWLVVALVVWILATLGAATLLREVEPPRERGRGVLSALGEMVRMRGTWIGLAFALVAAAGFEATGQLAGPFLIDRGVSSGLVGVFFGVFAVGAMLVGGLAGGVIADRRGRAASAAASLAGFVAMIVLLAATDRAGVSGAPVLMAVLTAMYFFVGFFTATSYAIFMDLTNARIGATQFSAFMAATNACESWSAWAGGRLAASQGYPAAFLVLGAVSLLGLPLLRLMRRRG
ncbi:MAG: MFS transporter [Acidobacteria bacterium]|nr:MFS transporter [Acidobacteriota bacterium]